MKIFKLTGFMKSEFVPNEERAQEIYVIFEKHGLRGGRMISAHKSAPKGHVAVFNGNIVTETAGKCWYGDIDITASFDVLKDIADEIGEDLYILREMDARFENENAGMKYWKEKAVEIIKSNK